MPQADVSRRPRVLVVTTSFPLAEDDTSGVFVARLVDAVAEQADVEVLTPAYRGATGGRGATASRPYPVTAVRYAPARWETLAHAPGGIAAAVRQRSRRLVWLVPLALRLASACRRRARRMDLVHAQWTLAGAIAGRVASVPVVTTLRGSDVHAGNVGRSRAAALALRATLRGSAGVVTVGEKMLADVAAAYPDAAARLSTIPNGIGEGFFSVAGTHPATGRRSLAVITVGNLVPLKDVATIVDAVARLGDATLTVVGDGPARPALERLAGTLGVADRVRFFGGQPPDEIPAALADADVFVLASLSEGRPNALLEAMAAGRAVVATDIDGVRPLVDDGETGLLFPPGDAEALAACLRALAGNPGRRRRLGDAAHRTVLAAGLTWQAAARRYVDLYRTIIAKTTGSF